MKPRHGNSYLYSYSYRQVFDLLNKKQRLRVLEDGHNVVQVVGLLEEAVHSTEDVLNLLRLGTQGRCDSNALNLFRPF